jgi:hypothetical protein
MTFKRLALISLLLLGMAGLGNTVAQAAGICVHPAGAGKCFITIQAAVDAANNGDSISIRTGKYVEQVTISGKDLALIGQRGAVIEAPPDMQDTLSPVGGAEGRPIILVTEGDVTIRNLTIDGANSAEANPFLYGIVYVNSGGVIRHNLVKNVGFGTPTLPIVNGFPSYQGNGIVVANQTATPRTVNISENKVVNFNSVGITVFAETDPNNPASSTLTANILDNVVVALGPNDVIDQWGIFLGGYNFADPQSSVTGTIKGNQISDHVTLAPHPLPSVGIVTLYTYQVEITDNVIKNGNVGMAANLSFSAHIANNRITGPWQAVPGSTGILLSGSDTAVNKNRFKKLDLGIFLFVDDPMFGSALNTAMDNNRFQDVSVDVLTGAGGTTALTKNALRTQPKFGPR